MRVENTMDRSLIFRGFRNESLACRFTHSDGPLDLSKVQLTVDGNPWPLLSVERPEPGMWQINARLRGLAPGPTRCACARRKRFLRAIHNSIRTCILILRIAVNRSADPRVLTVYRIPDENSSATLVRLRGRVGSNTFEQSFV